MWKEPRGHRVAVPTPLPGSSPGLLPRSAEASLKPGMLTVRCLRHALILVLVGARAVTGAPEAQGIAGKYQVAGTAHVSVSPFPAHDYPGDMTATLGPAPSSLSLRLEARGYACTLQVRADQDGTLDFPGGQTCALEITDPDARGHLDAQLQMGRGRVVHGGLELALQFDVKGNVQMKIPSKTILIFGKEIHSPATWAPGAPVHGTVSASGHGQRSPERTSR